MKVLVVKLHALGDLVIATPALRRLRQGLPEARLELLTTDWAAPAVQGNPNLDAVDVVPADLFFKRTPAAVLRLAGLALRLRRARYDAAVLFHRHPLVDKFLAAAGLKRRFGFSGKDTPRTRRLDENRHSALTAWELADLAVSELGGVPSPYPEVRDLTYDWRVTADEARTAREILHQANVPPFQFAALLPGGGINPHSAMAVKRWRAADFAALSERLRLALGLPSVLLGGASDWEVCREVERRAALQPVVNLCGRLSIRHSAAVMSLAAVAVTNDSGPLHIAGALQRPTVGIFGPTGPAVKLPPGPTTTAAWLGLPCSPCTFGAFKGCIFDRIRCLEDLTVERVMDAVHAALASGSSPR